MHTAHSTSLRRTAFRPPRRFFGGGFGGGFGFGQQQQEEETPKGNNVAVELEVTLADLYLGGHFKLVRDKNVVKPAPGTRKCNCKQKVVTQQMGPGMYQQYTTQVRRRRAHAGLHLHLRQSAA